MSQSKQGYAAEQLIELMLQLKKTTPAAAKQILNSQPQIAYALITLMVSMNAVNFEVFQKTLAEFAASQASNQPTQPVQPVVVTSPSAPVSAIPPHIQTQYRTPTPPTHTPTPPLGGAGAYSNGQAPPGYSRPPPQPSYHQPSSSGSNQGYGPYTQGSYQTQSSGGYLSTYSNSPYSTPTPQSQPQPPPPPPVPPQHSLPSINPAILAAIPDEQKAMVIQVLSMTQEQINSLPSQDRANILQLRATFGLS